jgi:NitT/TauT family transport system substrate-binding protein
MRLNRLSAGLAIGAALVLVTACGNTHGNDTPAAAGPITDVAGCEKGWTDPSDASPTRAPARCEPGTPAAKPLATKTTLVVTSATLKGEYLAHLRLGIAKGEFAKENLQIDLKQVPSADSMNLLASGQSDVSFGAPDAAFYNAVKAGVNAKWVMGNFFPMPASKTGLWIRDVNGRAGTIADLKGKTIGTVIGPGSVSMLPLVEGFKKAGLGFGDVKFQVLPATDLVTALQNGSIDASWLTDPYWTLVDGKPGFTYAIGQPPAEPLGGVIFGRNILNDKREAGVAFIRALIRTINTYFAHDYKSNAAFAQEVADVIELPIATVKQTPSLEFDWEIRATTNDRLQAAYIATGAFVNQVTVTEVTAVDRSFMNESVGYKKS